MSLKLLMNGVALAAIAAATLVTAPSAEAREWRRGSQPESHAGHFRGSRSEERSGGYVNRWGDVRGGDHGRGRGAFAHGRGQRWQGGSEYSRGGHHGHDWHYGRNRRDNTARNIAIGTFAAILGFALATESQRVQDDYYD